MHTNAPDEENPVSPARFQGRTAIVTGAASGIGAEITRILLDEGAWVIGADRELAGVPEGALPVRADVSSEADVAGLVATAVRERGRLDVMCNNAGIGSTVDVVECSVEEWDRVFAVNVRGVFLGCKHAARQMLGQEGG